MFREMRRKRQALSAQECIALLEKGSSGVLALEGDGGYTYAVPLSYLYEDNKIYFHCAKTGHKLDAICILEEEEEKRTAIELTRLRQE